MDIEKLRKLAQDNGVSDKEFLTHSLTFIDGLDPKNCSTEQIEEFLDVVAKHRPEIAKGIAVLADVFLVLIELERLSKKK